MPAKKTAKKRAAGKRSGAAGARKRVAKAVSTTAKKAKKSVSKGAKTAGRVAKTAKKLASNPRRTVRKAAESIHQTAGRARAMGDTVVTAGEMLKETAEFVDSMAARAKARTQGTGSQRRRAKKT